MKFINLTPHPIQIWDSDKNVIVYQATKPSARCTEEFEEIGIIEDENDNWIRIGELSYNQVYNLPEPQENTFYIVSVLVAQSCPDRTDLLVPYDLVRNENGSITGCRSLVRIK